MTGKKRDKAAGKKRVGANKPTKAKRNLEGSEAKAKTTQPKVKAKRAPRLNVDTYNRMQTAYFEKQSLRYVVKAARVAARTAKFYVEGPGKPDFGFVPIKQVWLDIQIEAQERVQLTLVKFREDQIKEAQEIVGTSVAELKLVRAEVFRRVTKYKESAGKDIETGASLGSALGSYGQAVRLVEHLLGGADVTMEHRGIDKYRDWTDDEIINYLETGRVPDHAR